MLSPMHSKTTQLDVLLSSIGCFTCTLPYKTCCRWGTTRCCIICAVSLLQHGFLADLCLQTAVNNLSESDKYYRKNQSERIFNADMITHNYYHQSIIITHRHRNSCTINRTRTDKCQKAHVLLPISVYCSFLYQD